VSAPETVLRESGLRTKWPFPNRGSCDADVRLGFLTLALNALRRFDRFGALPPGGRRDSIPDPSPRSVVAPSVLSAGAQRLEYPEAPETPPAPDPEIILRDLDTAFGIAVHFPVGTCSTQRNIRALFRSTRRDSALAASFPGLPS
jgi:hypothetical protein